MKFKVKALINFNDIENNVKRVAGKSEWECSKQRADYLLEHKAIEIVEEIKEKPKKVEIVVDNVANKPIEELKSEVKEAIEYLEKKKTLKKKKNSKK